MVLMTKEELIICDYSWASMNSVILPRVKLGIRTVVATSSVVAKSFPEGYRVIAGSPAKIIRYLDKEKFMSWQDEKNFWVYSKRYI